MGTPETSEKDKAAVRRGWKTIFLIVAVVDAIIWAAMTAVNYFAGDALISTFVQDGTPQHEGRVAWFFASLGNGFCSTIAIDFFLIIAGIIVGILRWLARGGMNKSRRQQSTQMNAAPSGETGSESADETDAIV